MTSDSIQPEAAPTAPTVAAICVSHPSRYGLLQRAILNFEKQTLANKELIIIVNSPGYYDRIIGFLRSGLVKTGEQNIRVLLSNFVTPVTAFFQAASVTTAQYLACWDDDNLQEPHRLEFQVQQAATLETISVLSATLVHYYDTENLAVVNYNQPGGHLTRRCAASSLVLNRKDIPLSVSFANSREPWAELLLLAAHKERKEYTLCETQPTLFMLGCNGDNYSGDKYRDLTSYPGCWSADKLDAAIPEDGFTSALATSLVSYPLAKFTLVGRCDAVVRISHDIDEASAKLLSELDSVNPPEDLEARIPNPQNLAAFQKVKKTRKTSNDENSVK